MGGKSQKERGENAMNERKTKSFSGVKKDGKRDGPYEIGRMKWVY